MKRLTRSHNTNLLSPRAEALLHIQDYSDPSTKIYRKFINDFKGNGIFAKTFIKKGSFVVEYRGKLLSGKEGLEIENMEQTYIYEFKYGGKNYWINATSESYGYGRLVNDAKEKKANCKMNIIYTYNTPHLCLFAKQDVYPDEEICYFYGINEQPWYNMTPPVDFDVESTKTVFKVEDEADNHFQNDCENIKVITFESNAVEQCSKLVKQMPVEKSSTSEEKPSTSVVEHLLSVGQSSKSVEQMPVEKSSTSVVEPLISVGQSSKSVEQMPVEKASTSEEKPSTSVVEPLISVRQSSKSVEQMPVEKSSTSVVEPLISVGQSSKSAEQMPVEKASTSEEKPSTSVVEPLISVGQSLKSVEQMPVEKSSTSVVEPLISVGQSSKSVKQMPVEKASTSEEKPSTSVVEPLISVRQSSKSVEQMPVEKSSTSVVEPLISVGQSSKSAEQMPVEKASTSEEKPSTSVVEPLISVGQPSKSVGQMSKPSILVVKPLVSVGQCSISVTNCLISLGEHLISVEESLTSAEQHSTLVEKASASIEGPSTSVIESLIPFKQETISDERSSSPVEQSFEITSITYSSIASSSPQSSGSSFGPFDSTLPVGVNSDDSPGNKLIFRNRESLTERGTVKGISFEINAVDGTNKDIEVNQHSEKVINESDTEELQDELPNLSTISLETMQNDSGLMLDKDLSIVDSDNDNEENGNDTSGDCNGKEKQQPYKKPCRICIFCGKASSKLTRHLTTVHRSEPRIAQAMKWNRKERLDEFEKIRREGIVMYNKNEAVKDAPNYQGERKGYKYMKLVMCSICTAFVSRRFFSAHRKDCEKRNDSRPVGIPMEATEAAAKKWNYSKEFITTILGKLRNDDIGSIVRSEENILYLGSKFYNKVKHKKEKIATVTKSVRSDMRQIANLYRSFKNLDFIEETHNNILDMFCRENYECLCVSIDEITLKEDNTVKAGSRLNLYYLILKCIKKLRDKMFLEKNDVLHNNLTHYYEFFKSSEDAFRGARYVLENTKLTKTRRPGNLPLEEDIHLIHAYSLTQIEKLCSKFEFFNQSSFVELRNLVMTRLTLINGRRGGEVGRLQIAQWKDGENGGWVDAQREKDLSDAEKILIKAMKMVYLNGKGNHHLVSVFIPSNTVAAMNKLSDPTIRSKCGIESINNFVFASTKNSTLNFSGWHALQSICSKLPLKHPDRINATSNRHRTSTVYASLDVPEHERELFFTHMGHSAEINKNVYQSPMALMGLTKIGPKLMEINGVSNGTGSIVTVVQPEESPSRSDLSTGTESEKNADPSEEIPSGSGLKTTKRKRKAFTSSDSDSEEEQLKNAGVVVKKYKGKLRRGRFSRSNNERPVPEKNCGSSNSINETSDSEESESNNSRRRSAKWNEPLHKAFMERFGDYVHCMRKNPFPHRSEMEKFIEDHTAGTGRLTVFQVRTKINNERKKFNNKTVNRLCDLGIY